MSDTNVTATNADNTINNSDSGSDTATTTAPSHLGVQGGGDSPTSSEWLTSISPEYHESIAKFKSPDELAKSYVNLQSMLGKKEIINGIVPLGEDASDEERATWQSEFNKLAGVPSSLEEYNLVFGEGDDVVNLMETPYGKEFAEVGHSLNMNDNQLRGIVSKLAEIEIAKESAMKESLAKTLAENDAYLTKTYGDKLEATTERINAFVGKHIPAEIMGMIKDANLLNNPHIFSMFDSLSNMFSEDSTPDNTQQVGHSTREHLRDELRKASQKNDIARMKQLEKEYSKLYS